MRVTKWNLILLSATKHLALTPTQRKNGIPMKLGPKSFVVQQWGLTNRNAFCFMFSVPGNNGVANDVDHEFDRNSSLAVTQ